MLLNIPVLLQLVCQLVCLLGLLHISSKHGAKTWLSFEADCVGMERHVDCMCNELHESLLCRQLDQWPALACRHLQPIFSPVSTAATMT